MVRLRSLRGFNSPAFPQATSRRRCGRLQSCLPRAPGKSVKGREVRRTGGRSIPDCPGLYRPLSSSLPRALGLRAWLLGGSGARRRLLRLPGRLKSGLAGGKRCRGCGLVGRGRRVGVGLGSGLRPGGTGPGSPEPPRPAGFGCAPHGVSFPADPAAATMVSKSDQLLIVVSILEGERPPVFFFFFLFFSLSLFFCNCCFPDLSRVVYDRGFVNLTNPVISAFVVP